MKIIVCSSPEFVQDEANLINTLFKLGIERYHLNKQQATEQAIAEILEQVDPSFLSKISLHSHFHLVLAYGVGGIHYSGNHRMTLGDDFVSKVSLYQGFGIKVSTEIDDREEAFEPADYALCMKSNNNFPTKENVFPVVSKAGIADGSYVLDTTARSKQELIEKINQLLSS